MVLSGLAQSVRRLFGQIRQVTLLTCNSQDIALQMEAREEQTVQVETHHPSVAFPPAGTGAGERGDRPTERGMDRLSLGSVQAASGQLATSRTVSIKRKLEELEIGIAESSGSATSQVRPRREAREEVHEGIAAESSGGERCYGDSCNNPMEAQPLDDEIQMREEGGNVATDDVDAVWDNEPDRNGSMEGISEANLDRSSTIAQDGGIVDMVEDNTLDINLTEAVADWLGNSGSHQGNPADGDLRGLSDCVAVLRPGASLATGEGDLVRSDAGDDMGDIWETEHELENSRIRYQDKDVAFGQDNESDSRSFSNSCELSEADSDCGTSSVCGTIATCSTSNGSSLFNESFRSVGSNVIAGLSGSLSQPRLQFFVRTYIDGRTIVLHANALDTIESVHRQILLRTGLPISEQRLIYFGRQLQQDQTLAECRVVSDATLNLVARMRSTALPHSWQLVNELVATVRLICSMEDEGGHLRLKLMQTQDSIRSSVKEFLKMAAKSLPVSEHMQVFQLAGATSALVILLLSPVETNRECAEESMKLFLCANDDFLPGHIHCHCAPVLLDFCKLLAKGAPSHPLYAVCRNSLACLLDTVEVAHGSTYFNDAKAESIVHDFAPFVNELALRLSSSLRFTARAYAAKEASFNFSLYVKEGQDFTAFVIKLCKAMEVCKGIETLGSSNASRTKVLARAISISTECGEEANIGFAGALHRDDLSGGITLAVEGTPNDVGGRGAEIGSHSWLYTLFQGLLLEIDNCLEQVEQVAERPQEVSVLVAADDRPFGWAPFLVVLKGLHAIAKLYEGAMEDLLTILRARRLALNVLIRQSRWQDDHFWLLEHKFLLDFESKRRLVLGMLPEPQDDHDERQDIVVHRAQLLSESFEMLAYVEPDVIQGGLSVEFASEEATGPGVLREWFSLICREIFNPQNALFLSCPNDRRRFFPNPASGVNPGHLMYFRFCGRVIALALMHKVQVDVVFALTFFKQLAGLPISWEDAKDADPFLYESCRKILEMDAEFVDSDALGLTFVNEVEEIGTSKTMELCSGGKDMSVNSQNRLLYVELLVQRRFGTSVAEQVKFFCQGFCDLLANGNHHQQFFQALEPEDFDLMLYGKDRNICLEDWKAHTEYHDYSSSDCEITWFWKVVEGMTMEQRRRLLFFSTSVAHLPAEGFVGLSSKFHIHKAHTDTSWLPTAHTCFYQLVLPPYPSYAIMHAKLHAVIEGHIFEGFGFA